MVAQEQVTESSWHVTMHPRADRKIQVGNFMNGFESKMIRVLPKLPTLYMYQHNIFRIVVTVIYMQS